MIKDIFLLYIINIYRIIDSPGSNSKFWVYFIWSFQDAYKYWSLLFLNKIQKIYLVVHLMPSNASNLVNAVDKKDIFSIPRLAKFLFDVNSTRWPIDWTFDFQLSILPLCPTMTYVIVQNWKGHLARAALWDMRNVDASSTGMLNIELYWMLWTGKPSKSALDASCISLSHLCCFCTMTSGPDIASLALRIPKEQHRGWGWFSSSEQSNTEFEKRDEGHLQIPVMKWISHRDVTYSIRNMVKNMVTTLFGNKWLLDLWWPLHNIGKCQSTV